MIASLPNKGTKGTVAAGNNGVPGGNGSGPAASIRYNGVLNGCQPTANG